MEDTCRKEKCPMWMMYSDNTDEPCINYVQSFWTPEGRKEPKLISDCVPKRTFLMLQHIVNHLDGIQKSAEQERNTQIGLIKIIAHAINEKRPVNISIDGASLDVNKLINDDTKLIEGA